MRNFISKNLGYILVILMISGMAVLGFGLDWDQSQIAWKAAISGWLIGIGSVLFAGSIVLLITNTRSGG